MLSENIKKFRKANNMSQDELAEELEVTRQSVSLWETGQTQPSLDNIVALAKLFDVSTDDLLTDSNLKSVGGEKIMPDKKNKRIYILIGCIIVIAVLLTVVLLWKFGNSDSSNKNNMDSGAVQEVNSEESIEDSSAGSSNKNNVDSVVVQEVKPEKNIEGSNSDSGNKNNTDSATVQEVKPKKNVENLYGYLKNFVVKNGTTNGDYSYYSKTADNYGGNAAEDFSLYYWGDTDTVEFCLHRVIDDTFSVNFYLYVPKSYTGKYEYVSSYYYRDTGEPLYEARGTITAGEFTKNYPLNCNKYIGSTDVQNEFMEMSRQGVSNLISCLEKFISVEKLEYTFKDFGFTAF